MFDNFLNTCRRFATKKIYCMENAFFIYYRYSFYPDDKPISKENIKNINQNLFCTFRNVFLLIKTNETDNIDF